MLSKTLLRDYYLSFYERQVKFAYEIRLAACKCTDIERANLLHDDANLSAQKATEAMQALATMR